MNRIFPPVTIQANSHSLRNNLCRLGTPKLQAEVSSHLRNFAVAEVIALIGILDSHPKIKGPPTIVRAGASFQQCSGTRDNPFCHVAPSSLLLNGTLMSSFFRSSRAQSAIARIYGMGVMAPDDWAELNAFDGVPAEQNRADNVSERYSTSSGLVAAFERTAANAARQGKWDASGTRRHNRSSLEDFVHLHYYRTWKPGAIEAYHASLTHLSGQLAAAIESGNAARTARLRQRIEVVHSQRAVLIEELISTSEATNNMLTATALESWKQ